MSQRALLLLVLFISTASVIVADKPAGAITTTENTWKMMAPMPQGGGVFGAAVVDGKIYAFGGYAHNRQSYFTSGEYDPSTNTWADIPPIPTPRVSFAVAACAGKVYVMGGHDPDNPAIESNVTET